MSPKGNKFQHRQLRLIQTSIRPDLISVRDSSGKSVHPTEKVQLFVLPPDDAAPEAWLTRVQGLDVLRSLRLGPPRSISRPATRRQRVMRSGVGANSGGMEALQRSSEKRQRGAKLHPNIDASKSRNCGPIFRVKK